MAAMWFKLAFFGDLVLFERTANMNDRGMHALSKIRVPETQIWRQQLATHKMLRSGPVNRTKYNELSC